MPTVKEKIDERASCWSEMENIMRTADDEGRDLTAEERQTYDKAEGRLDTLTADITRLKGFGDRSAEFGADPETTRRAAEVREDEPAKGYDDVFNIYMRSGVGMLEPSQRRTLQAGFDADANKELRAAGVATGAAGGYFVPQGFRMKVVEAMKTFGNVRAVAEVINTETGNDLPWPTSDDTANVGAILGENTQVTEEDVVLGQETLGAFMYTSKLVRVSLQLLQDSAFALEPWLARKLGERIGRIQNSHFTVGVGTTQPEGVQTNATIGVTGPVGTTVTATFDSLIDLELSVDAAYRGSGRARYMLNDLSIGILRKVKDTTGQYIWQPSVQVGAPDTINGFAVTPNNDMPVMAANAKSILFGDFFSYYVIRDVLGFQLMRLEERYADFLQVGFLGFSRADGIPQDTGAVKAFRNSAT